MPPERADAAADRGTVRHWPTASGPHPPARISLPGSACPDRPAPDQPARIGLPRIGLPRIGLPRIGLPRIGLPLIGWAASAWSRQANRIESIRHAARGSTDGTILAKVVAGQLLEMRTGW
jgi:hypothetical protein